jgi:serine/threonine protein phosphatase PrpC
MVVACDGIWERFEEDSGPLMTQIKGELSQQKDGKTVLENFFDENISKGGIQPHGRDNMTAILVEFLH